jgi:hypothetical protein
MQLEIGHLVLGCSSWQQGTRLVRLGRPQRLRPSAHSTGAPGCRATLAMPKGSFLKDGREGYDSAASETLWAQPSALQTLTLTTDDGAKIILKEDGTFKLFEVDAEESHGRLVGSGRLRLPDVCSGTTMRVVSRRADRGHVSSAKVQWGPVNNPHAELTLEPPPPAVVGTRGWCLGLARGFVLSFSVAAGSAPAAEIALDLETAGHWFGGGHFIRQVSYCRIQTLLYRLLCMPLFKK